MGGLKKDTWPDGYIASGTLEGIDGPGRRTVRRLEIRGLSPDSVGGITGLARFPDLKHLVLEKVRGVDFAPLSELALDSLDIVNLDGGDLAPVAKLRDLRYLGLMDVSPDPIEVLPLPSSLESLALVNDDARHSGAAVGMLVRAIDWTRLGALQYLELRVGGNHDLAPVGVDLGFLAHLPELRTLRMEQGIIHDGPEPSPLEPPFRGLSRNLTWVRIDAPDPEPLRAALEEIMARPAATDSGPHGVGVYARPPRPQQPPAGEWAIHAYDDDGGWGVYGSLYAALDSDDETEYEAADRAEERLKSADAQLAKRLDFDPESNGTGIYAESREDLETALRLLGIID